MRANPEPDDATMRCWSIGSVLWLYSELTLVLIVAVLIAATKAA